MSKRVRFTVSIDLDDNEKWEERVVLRYMNYLSRSFENTFTGPISSGITCSKAEIIEVKDE